MRDVGAVGGGRWTLGDGSGRSGKWELWEEGEGRWEMGVGGLRRVAGGGRWEMGGVGGRWQWEECEVGGGREEVRGER